MIRHELKEVPGAFWKGYYQPRDVAPGLPVSLGQRVCSAAMEICAQAPLPTAQEDIEKIVLESFLNALEPHEDGYDPVKPAALTMMAQALNYNMPVYIWTIGDTGVEPMDDDELDPSGSCQKLKIKKGQILERLIDKVHPDQMYDGKLRNLHIDTCEVSKKSSLLTILSKARDQQIKKVYIADDLPENGAIVDEFRADYSDLEIYFWQIKEDWDTKGSMAAYARDILPKLSANDADGVRAILVLDLDNTIINTTAALDRTAELTRRKLSEMYNK